jgi:hypothetical protein
MNRQVTATPAPTIKPTQNVLISTVAMLIWLMPLASVHRKLKNSREDVLIIDDVQSGNGLLRFVVGAPLTGRISRKTYS